MDRHLKHLLKKYNLRVIYMTSNRKGYLVRTTPDKPNIIVVKKGLSEEKAYQVIQHEIGHYLKDKKIQGNYSKNYITRIKCESVANDYMINNLVLEEISLGYDPCSINYINFAESFGISNYSKVRAALAKYIIRRK